MYVLIWKGFLDKKNLKYIYICHGVINIYIYLYIHTVFGCVEFFHNLEETYLQMTRLLLKLYIYIYIYIYI